VVVPSPFCGRAARDHGIEGVQQRKSCGQIFVVPLIRARDAGISRRKGRRYQGGTCNSTACSESGWPCRHDVPAISISAHRWAYECLEYLLELMAAILIIAVEVEIQSCFHASAMILQTADSLNETTAITTGCSRGDFPSTISRCRSCASQLCMLTKHPRLCLVLPSARMISRL
jgi:hypothetical protein